MERMNFFHTYGSFVSVGRCGAGCRVLAQGGSATFHRRYWGLQNARHFCLERASPEFFPTSSHPPLASSKPTTGRAQHFHGSEFRLCLFGSRVQIAPTRIARIAIRRRQEVSKPMAASFGEPGSAWSPVWRHLARARAWWPNGRGSCRPLPLSTPPHSPRRTLVGLCAKHGAWIRAILTHSLAQGCIIQWADWLKPWVPQDEGPIHVLVHLLQRWGAKPPLGPVACGRWPWMQGAGLWPCGAPARTRPTSIGDGRQAGAEPLRPDAWPCSQRGCFRAVCAPGRGPQQPSTRPPSSRRPRQGAQPPQGLLLRVGHGGQAVVLQSSCEVPFRPAVEKQRTRSRRATGKQ